MILATIELKWDDFLRKILHWQDNHRSNRFIKMNSVRERSIGILQKRYGYNREQATYQLDKYYSKARLG